LKITALDLGATTGVCFGEAGERFPEVASWDIRAPTRAQRAALLRDFLAAHLLSYCPDALWVEAPPPLAGMMQRGTNIDTLQALYGFDMIVGLVAFDWPVKLESIDAQAARQHFLGVRPKKGKGKEAVLNRCKLFRWPVANNNEADAACIWWYACAHEAPNAWMRAVQDQRAARAS